MISRIDYFAGLAMQALLQNADLKFAYKASDNPPNLNSYAFGKYGETRKSAEEILKELSFKIANEMVKGE